MDQVFQRISFTRATGVCSGKESVRRSPERRRNVRNIWGSETWTGSDAGGGGGLSTTLGNDGDDGDEGRGEEVMSLDREGARGVCGGNSSVKRWGTRRAGAVTRAGDTWVISGCEDAISDASKAIAGGGEARRGRYVVGTRKRIDDRWLVRFVG